MLFLLPLESKAQESFYDFPDFGDHSINYTDTVIFDSSIDYAQFGYDGKAPMFVQTWYPGKTVADSEFLLYRDFQVDDIPEHLSRVYGDLNEEINQIFIRDAILLKMATGDDMDYREKTVQEVFEKVISYESRSIRSDILRKLDFPVITYHHGSQGLSTENSVMAEYFASHGYIFVSANFHLPYQNTTYGLLPFELEKENRHDQRSAKTLVGYARSLTKHKKLFFIFHSWGAREGWCFLNEPNQADGFVSLETTIEYKNDPEVIQEIWPYVYEALVTEKNSFFHSQSWQLPLPTGH